MDTAAGGHRPLYYYGILCFNRASGSQLRFTGTAVAAADPRFEPVPHNSDFKDWFVRVTLILVTFSGSANLGLSFSDWNHSTFSAGEDLRSFEADNLVVRGSSSEFTLDGNIWQMNVAKSTLRGF